MREYTYEEHIERTRAAIERRILQAREHEPGSVQHGAYLGTVSGGVKAPLDGGAKLSRSVNNRGGYGPLLLDDGHQNGSSMSRG